MAPSIVRNLEKNDIYINRWMSGLITNRSPLFTPLSSMGLQIISRYDTLCDGLNCEISPRMTLTRRYGFSRYSSTALDVDEFAESFFSFKNNIGTVWSLVDTNSRLASYTPTGVTTVYDKSTTEQTSFLRVGDYVYLCDGTSAQKWNGTTLSEWGIVPPASAPSLTISAGNGMTVPVPGTFTSASTGGVLAPGTYYYRISATNSLGETGASDEWGFTIPSGTSTNTITVTWTAVTNATGYNVYGRTLGAELLIASVSGGSTVTYVDDGTITPSGPLPSGLLTTANGGYKYVYVYGNSTTGHISSASPYSVSTGDLSDQTVTVAGVGSTDPQVDTVQIYRTLDGGANYYYLTTVSNTPTWSYTDSTPDSGLNDLLLAPIAGVNDPPPDGIGVSAYWNGYVWVATGNYLYFGGGSAITNGVPEESFPASNVFTLPGKVVAMAPTSSGLVVWTQSDTYMVTGSTAAAFVCQIWQSNLGVYGQNCVCQDGDSFYLYTMQGQLYNFSSSLTEIGFAIQGNLAEMNPANVYMTLHRYGTDEGIFIGDGSTDLYRYSISQTCWSTLAQPVGGVGCLKSIEVTPAVWKLMMGRPTGSGYLLARDLTAFADDGTAYPAFATVGQLTMAPPRQAIQIESICLGAMSVGAQPTVSVLVNEISGTFQQIGITPNGTPYVVPEPFELPSSTSYRSLRYDITASQVPLNSARVLSLQIKVAFATEAAKNELLSLGVS